MTHEDKLAFIAYLIHLLVVTSGEWVELPKLTRQTTSVPNIKIIEKVTKPTASPTTQTPTTPPTTKSTKKFTSTTPSSVFKENGFGEPENYIYTNQTYTFLDPNLESILLKAHQTLIEEARHPIKHKLRFLKRLQNSILRSRSQFLWTTDNLEGRGHGHMMSFPSLEGALMTISFLTFAVFLIKIVRQFLQGLQGGNNMTIEVPGTPAPVKVNKLKRGLNYDYSEMERILEYISELKINHKP